jgi:hypothetical protein
MRVLSSSECEDNTKSSVNQKEKMKLLKAVPTMFCLAMFASTMFSPIAKADDWNRKTTITFSGPVEIPGVHVAGWGVLPAGTYVFKILNSQADRHIVQIFNKDETVCYATIMAIPNFRLKATDKTVVTFRERPAGQPEALRAWFYPGRQWGEEFVYPKAKALELAKETNMPVLFTPEELPVEVAVPITVDAPFIAQMQAAPVRAYQPTGNEIQLAEVVTPPPPTGMRAAVLPTTASPLPLIALFGFLSLCGGLMAQWIKRSTVQSIKQS